MVRIKQKKKKLIQAMFRSFSFLSDDITQYLIKHTSDLYEHLDKAETMN